jgi:hypothetical protein
MTRLIHADEASLGRTAKRDQDAEFLLVLERIEIAVKRSEHGRRAGGVGHGGFPFMETPPSAPAGSKWLNSAEENR